MKLLKPALTVIVVLGATACDQSTKDRAAAQASQYAQNAVGDQKGPVWDAMICYYDIDLKSPRHVSGYVNGRGKGAQLFVVNFGTDGKPFGDVELKPIRDPDPSEVGYWFEIERLRQSDNDQQCSDWNTFTLAASSTYWHAIQDGLGPSAAMEKLIDTRKKLMKFYSR